MGSDKKYFYAKFKMDMDLGIIRALKISEDKSNIDEWNGVYPEAKGPEATETTSYSTDSFKDVAIDFEDSIHTFQISVPFIMDIMPFMHQVYNNFEIRRYLKKKGEQIESGEFEVYRASLDHIGAVTAKLQKAAAIAAGIRRVPSVFMMGLVSSYDLFLSKLIRSMFLACPQLLSSSERNLSFKDLMEIGSLEAARERIIEKEIESVIRESHTQQIVWIENKLGIPLRKDLKIWPEFIEICERRNLLAHTGGVISSQYIAVCKANGFDTGDSLEGRRLEISAEYYERAVSVILELGIKLTQVLWRKLIPDQVGEADKELNGFAYRLIVKKKYSEASTILRFGLFEMKKHGKEATRKQMVVNLANAEKLGGNKAEAEEILAKEDWSASTHDYRICVAAVRDDVQAVTQLMKVVVEMKLMEVVCFREWPVFEKVRSDPVFIETFEREFGEKIMPDRQADTTTGEPDVEDEDQAVTDSAGDINTLH